MPQHTRKLTQHGHYHIFSFFCYTAFTRKKIYHLYISHIILQYSIILFIFIVGLSSTKNSLLLYTLYYCLVMYFVCTFLKAFLSQYIISEHHRSFCDFDKPFNNFDTFRHDDRNEKYMYERIKT